MLRCLECDLHAVAKIEKRKKIMFAPLSESWKKRKHVYFTDDKPPRLQESDVALPYSSIKNMITERMREGWEGD